MSDVRELNAGPEAGAGDTRDVTFEYILDQAKIISVTPDTRVLHHTSASHSNIHPLTFNSCAI